MSNNTQTVALVSIEEGRIAIFGTGKGAPSKRTWDEWRAQGFYPFHKIGKRVFLDVEQVRRALDRRFNINAKEAR